MLPRRVRSWLRARTCRVRKDCASLPFSSAIFCGFLRVALPGRLGTPAGEQIINGFGKRFDEDIIAFPMIFVWRLVWVVKPLTTIRRILLFGFAPEVRCLASLFCWGPVGLGCDRLARLRFFWRYNPSQISSRGNDTMDDPDAMYPGFTETGLTSAEIQSLLDRSGTDGGDTIEGGRLWEHKDPRSATRWWREECLGGGSLNRRDHA